MYMHAYLNLIILSCIMKIFPIENDILLHDFQYILSQIPNYIDKMDIFRLFHELMFSILFYN